MDNITVRKDLRNIAIIAHVDHGKTTLVDGLLRQSGIFRENESIAERVMDSNELERERGITILSKNTAIIYKGVRINIVDTPGHADFGGEVERVMNMVNGVLLLVDAFDGPMPQTRFVLRKALAAGLKPILVVNKIDRPGSRPHEVADEVLDLFIELEASDGQLDFPVIYASSRDAYAVRNPDDEKKDLEPLLKAIVDYVPPPAGIEDAPLQMIVSSIEYDDYVGRIGIGRIERGVIAQGTQVAVCRWANAKEDAGEAAAEEAVPQRLAKVGRLYKFTGLKREECENAKIGDIVAVSGISGINIGDTLCDVERPEALPFIEIDEPTVTMEFLVNNSPFAGREGTYVTSRHLRERLYREIESNVSMQVEDTESADTFKVSGRGELHLSILIETMRRQGYEFQVSKPRVIFRKIGGVECEPFESLTIDIPEEYTGIVMEKLGVRKAEMTDMRPAARGFTRLEYKIPSRGLIGFRSEFLTDTKGNGIMNHIFFGYEPLKGDIPTRQRGSLVAWEDGEAVIYGLYNAQERGTIFISAGTKVYKGMIVGENLRQDDMTVNVCKKKHVTNMRAAGSDDALRLTPPVIFSLEQAIEFLADDELLEVTPKNTRLRKKILDTELRAKSRSKSKE